MDIKILHSWLMEHLETDAKPNDISRCVSLCGPTFDRTNPKGKDWIYKIEVTTNRVDAMCVRGIAREAATILPRFGFKAKLKPLKLSSKIKTVKNEKIRITSDPNLTHRVMGVVLEVEGIDKSPDWIKERLEASGIRSLNQAVDITNYVMTEIGHPTHVFDYDLVKPVMKLRESRKGEKIISLDNKEYILPGGDIVIEDANGQIIDLPGIIGTKNSIVNDNTKRILFFLETNDALRIRKTSTRLGIRTAAAILNEKGVDPELAETAMYRGIELFKSLMDAKVISEVYDIYNNRHKAKTVYVEHSRIERVIGTKVNKSEIVRILTSLGFSVSGDDKYKVEVPSSRSRDIDIPEDVIEEVARIHGYHNIPNILMSGIIPKYSPNADFDKEMKIRRLLTGLGAHEVYTYSMVSKDMTDKNSLKIKNPLGSDNSYMRTSLKNSLLEAAKSNLGVKEPFHFFEMANVYLPQNNELPEEVIMLAGIFSNSDYRIAKGIIESLLEKINIDYKFVQKNKSGFSDSERLEVVSNIGYLGEFGKIYSGMIYYEFDVEALITIGFKTHSYIAIPQYPSQVEDLTLEVPEGVKVGELMNLISQNGLVSDVELRDIYEGKKKTYTFRIWYQSNDKTLTNNEVDIIRNKLINQLQSKFKTRVS